MTIDTPEWCRAAGYAVTGQRSAGVLEVRKIARVIGRLSATVLAGQQVAPNQPVGGVEI
jgi:hypothetical protein